jgi:hypothetical protein
MPPPEGSRTLPGDDKEETMYHWMDGWDWIWMSFMMVFWVVLLGAVVFIAVRLGQRPPGGKQS